MYFGVTDSVVLVCRLLYGTLHVRAYDWSESSEPSSSSGSSSTSSSINNTVSDSNSSSHYGVNSARLVTDRVLTAPAPTSVLYPAAGGGWFWQLCQLQTKTAALT